MGGVLHATPDTKQGDKVYFERRIEHRSDRIGEQMSRSPMANPPEVGTQGKIAASRRKSVTAEGLAHKHPVPNACRIGNLVFSGAIHGVNPTTHELPAGMADQSANVFANMRAIIEAAGGSAEDIIKVEIYLRDSGDRNAVNEEWLRMFPDPQSRPARHVRPLPPDSPSLVQSEFIAVLEDASDPGTKPWS
ncbi:RidA family protein [Mesorhizobium sp. PL10]